MSKINTFIFSNLMQELETRRKDATNEINLHSALDDKKRLQKEVSKLNSILNSMTDYKINYIDEQPVKDVSDKKSKKKETSATNQSYGINSMISK